MKKYRNPLDEVYEKWRTANPTDTSIASSPSGYRRCIEDGCIVQIEVGQERLRCYGHGGLPNEKPTYRRGMYLAEWAEHQEVLRRRRRKKRRKLP